LPEQLLPEQLLPEQLLPEQLLPEQLLPEQLLPEQLLPEQLLPEQLLPETCARSPLNSAFSTEPAGFSGIASHCASVKDARYSGVSQAFTICSVVRALELTLLPMSPRPKKAEALDINDRLLFIMFPLSQ